MKFNDLLERLIQGQDLSHAEMQETMQAVMSGGLSAAQIASLAVALRIKGETVTELLAAAEVMRNYSDKVIINDDEYLIDTCGTGGDSHHTFNVSTTSAFVAAAAGAKVAKHGGRSVSSSCGSADVIEALGVRLAQTPERISASVQQVGLGFIFASHYHRAMQYATPVRKDLGVRTLFNLLGPLTNPAGAKRQVLGVFSAGWTHTLAAVLQRLGSVHVMVVSGQEGLDELALSGSSMVSELKDGYIHDYKVHPHDFGFDVCPLSAIQVRNKEEAVQMLNGVLRGEAGPARDIVLLNAGAAIYVAGLVASLQEGIVVATHTLDSGLAQQKLIDLIAFTE